jgi:hypothetical protein
MFKLDWRVCLGLAILIVGIIIGFPAGRCSKQCPEIIAGQSIIDTIKVHDTVRVEKLRREIVYKDSIVHDTINGKPVIDSFHCVSASEVKGNFFVEAQFCSKEFPRYKPQDLLSHFTYQLPPDTSRYRVDTISRPQKKYYVGIGPYVGYGWEDLKTIKWNNGKLQFGLSVNAGRAFKQF